MDCPGVAASCPRRGRTAGHSLTGLGDPGPRGGGPCGLGAVVPVSPSHRAAQLGRRAVFPAGTGGRGRSHVRSRLHGRRRNQALLTSRVTPPPGTVCLSCPLPRSLDWSRVCRARTRGRAQQMPTTGLFALSAILAPVLIAIYILRRFTLGKEPPVTVPSWQGRAVRRRTICCLPKGAAGAHVCVCACVRVRACAGR